jgi:flagellar protein FliS
VAYGKNAFEYQKIAVNSASPVGLVIMLYDGALRFMARGREAIVAGDLKKQDDQLRRAQKIVIELMTSLDMHRGGDVAKNLFALYAYATEKLVEANIKDDPKLVDEAISIFSGLRSSWAELERRSREDRPLEVALAG